MIPDKVQRAVKWMSVCVCVYPELYVGLITAFSMNKTKVSGECQNLMQKAARWPCGVCGRGVWSNSIQCTSCQKWVRRSVVV